MSGPIIIELTAVIDDEGQLEAELGSTPGPPGPVGPNIIDTGSYGSPQLVSTNVSVPADSRARFYVKGASGPVVGPTIGNGSGTQELFIYGTDDVNYVLMQPQANLRLSGEIALKSNTVLTLHWIPSQVYWQEASRREG